MHKLKLKYILANELKKVNRSIDLKIAYGISYKREAQRHKRLVRQLDGLARERTFAFF